MAVYTLTCRTDKSKKELQKLLKDKAKEYGVPIEDLIRQAVLLYISKKDKIKIK